MAIWDPLFTNWVRNNIYDQLLLPKITEEVIKWDPTTDIVPIHIWVHPWAPILGKIDNRYKNQNTSHNTCKKFSILLNL